MTSVRALRLLITAVLSLALGVTSLSSAAQAAVAAGGQPTGLTVNGLATPTDLEASPRFGWQLPLGMQSAYQVRVATTAGGDEVWDSGKVESNEQSNAPYGGPELDKSERYHWQVRTWDADDTASAWSDSTWFGTGAGSTWGDAKSIWAPAGKYANWTDYTLETKFTIVQNSASVTFHSNSTSAFYLWQIRADTNSLKKHTGTNLIEDKSLAGTGITLTSGTQYALKIVLDGATAKTYINDVLVDTTTGLTTYPSGGFGFRNGSSEQARYDDISVKDASGATLYANDFSRGSTSDPDFPNLAVSGGQLVVGTGKNEYFAGSWANYTLTTKVKIEEVATGIAFRASDSSNSYMWQLRGADNQLKPHTQINGTYKDLKTVNLPAGTLSLGTTVTVRIQAIHNTIKTWINDVLVDTTTDTTFRRGVIGFRNGSSEVGRFSDLSVTSESPNGGTLLATSFAAADRTFACGTVADGILTIGKGQTCLPNGLTANWALLRKDTTLADKDIAWATLFATGNSTNPAKQYVYKAYVNGKFVGLGPTRSIGSEARYDGFDVTDELRAGASNTIGALAYTTSGQQFMARLVVEYTDGSRQVVDTDGTWKATAGDSSFPNSGSIGTGFYSAPKENLNAGEFPYGFDSPGFDDSAWSTPAVKAALPDLTATPTQKVREELKAPVKIVDKGNGNYFVDFGRTWVGGVHYTIDEATAGSKVDLRFGEVTSAENTVRYALNTGNNYQDIVTLKGGSQTVDTWGMRVFRYLEIVGAPEPVTVENLQALALVYPFDEDAAKFTSSDANLEKVWQLSKNTIESLNVNFYTDSWTRERINYEADGYLQLMSTLNLDDDLSLGRYSMNYFKNNRTWPTEWPIYVILAVHDAWRQTGDTEQVASYYSNLQSKLPTKWLEASTGLIRKTSGSSGGNSSTDDDIVDWPASERDGFSFQQYNTVINSISYRAYRDMAAMATSLGKDADAESYTAIADRMRDAINERLYNPSDGKYDDGMNAAGALTGHYSLHASAFALAFGVPETEELGKVASYVGSRGMACSVYCAGFLIKGLYEGGNGQAALDLMTATGTKSWINMINLGAGATMEAWDPSLKPNLTYSHPWAASPAFTVPTGLFGVQSVDPGYAKFRVKPQPGTLQYGTITVPTVRGQIGVAFDHGDNGDVRMSTNVPGNTTATLSVPTKATEPTTLYVDRVPQTVTPADGYLTVKDVAPGCHILTTEAGGAAAADKRLTSICTSSPVTGPKVDVEISHAGQDGWFGIGATATLTADSVATIEYRFGDDDWLTYTAPVTVPAGEVSLTYRATGANGAQGDSGSVTAKVDLAPPTAKASRDGRTVTLTASDDASGVGAIGYRLDDGDWITYTEPVVVDGGAHTITYRAADVAGNVSADETIDVEKAPTGPAAAPVATKTPSISGSPKVGKTLTAKPGSWDIGSLAFTYQWVRDGVPIAPATSRTYRATAADAGHRLAVKITARKAGHVPGVAQSARTAKVVRASTKTRMSVNKRTTRSGQKIRVTVNVTSSAGTVPGKVRFTYRGKVVRTTSLKSGKVIATFRPTVRGKHTLKATYLTSTGYSSSSTKVNLRVK